MRRRVVITGVGAVTPLGVGAAPLIERWSAGETARCPTSMPPHSGSIRNYEASPIAFPVTSSTIA